MNKYFFNNRMQGKILLFISILFVTVILISVFLYIGNNYALIGDDYYFSIYLKKEPVFSPLVFIRHGGGYIGHFLSKMLSFYIPVKLGIHPCDFFWHNFIKGIFTSVIMFLIAKFAVIYFKSDKLLSLIYIFISLCFVYLSLHYSFNLLGVNYKYYRYVFSLLFYVVFMYLIYKNIISNKINSSKAEIIICSFCAFETGTASEIEIFSAAALFFLILLYQIIVRNKENYKFNLNKTFYIPFGACFFAAICFISSKGFQKVASERGLGSTLLTKELISDFLCQFRDLYIFNFKIYWIIFLILTAAAFYFAYKNKEIKKVIFPVLLNIAILITVLSLVLLGRTFYNQIDFWLVHDHIRFLYGMLLIIPMFITFGCLIKSVLKTFKSHQYRKIFLISVKVIIIVFILSACCFIFSIRENIKAANLTALNFKQLLYKTEKIYGFYRLKGEIPYLPHHLNVRNSQLINDKQYGYICERNIFFAGYYSSVYNDNTDEFQIYRIEKDAVNVFIENVGVFHDYELKDIKFSRLFDEDFVLNKK